MVRGGGSQKHSANRETLARGARICPPPKKMGTGAIFFRSILPSLPGPVTGPPSCPWKKPSMVPCPRTRANKAHVSDSPKSRGGGRRLRPAAAELDPPSARRGRLLARGSEMSLPHNSRGVVGRGCLENRAGGCSCLSGTQPATASRPAWQKRGDEDAEVVRRSVMPSSFTPRLSGCSYRRRKLPETLRHACTKMGTGAIYADAVGKQGRERFMLMHPRRRRGPVRPPGGR